MKNCYKIMIDPMKQKKIIHFISSKYFIILIISLFPNVTSLDLSIDNRLYVSPSDCYTRISIGSRLADSLVISTIQIATVSDCEAACSANGTSCSAFSFGVDTRGNGTCMLGRVIPQRQDNFQRDPEYDVYLKGRMSLIGCRNSQNTLLSNSLSTLPTGFNTSRSNSRINQTVGTNIFINNENSGWRFGNSSFSNAFENSLFNRAKNQSNENGFTNTIAFPEFLDDDRTRIFDILQNKHDHKYHGKNDNNPKSNEFHEFDNESHLFRNDFVANTNWNGKDTKNVWISLQNKVKNIPSVDELYGRRIGPLKSSNEFSLDTTILNAKPDYSSIDTDINDYPTASDSYSNFGQRINSNANFEIGPTNYDNSWWLDSSFRVKHPTTYNFADTDTHGLSGIDYLYGDKACFRKIFTGKRIIDAYVRRAMECDTLHDCHRMCEYERGFTCEGFNYRSSGVGKSICELTSIPSNRVDMNRDFEVDRRCQFYERDLSQQKCHQKKNKLPPRPLSTYPPQSINNWWAANPRPISWNSSDRNRGNYGPTRDAIPRDPPSPSPPSHPPSSTHTGPYGGSFNGNTQLTLELPRPIDPNRRYPISHPPYNSDDSYLPTGLNGDHRTPSVRPLDSYYHHERPGSRPSTTDDFYYRDRLPPHHGYNRPNLVPSTLAGGFDGYNGNGYSYGRPAPSGWQNLSPNHGAKYPNKRIGYGPDPETNEVGPTYIPADRRPPPKFGGDWDNYGHSYADSYHTNYIGGGSKYPSQQPSLSYPPRLPPSPSSHSDNDQPHYYEPFHNYGGGYGYSNRPALPPKIHPNTPANQCFSVRSTTGFKLTRGIVHKSYLTTNLVQCEKLCEAQKDFVCRTFAYRYSLASTSPFNNCLLSDAAFENLVFYTDLEPDRDYDIYAMVENSKSGQAHTKTPNTRRPRPADECFWRVRSGFCMPPSVIKKPIHVDGMGECQVQCVGSREFTCRSFVFRYETYSPNGMPNCFLSDWPAMEVEPKDMQDMDGAEFYERGSFGRGCEPHYPNNLPSSPSQSSSPLGGTHNRLSPAPPPPPPPPPDDASCYADYDRPCKLTPYAIIFASRVASQTDCRRQCSIMRQRNMAPCMSFNFRIVDDHKSDNCFLSDISMRDLRPNLDYTHDQDYILYVWRESEPKCSVISYHTDNRQPNFHPLNDPFGPVHASIDGKPYAKPENPYYYEITIPEPNRPGPPDPSFHSNANDGYDGKFFIPNVPDEFFVFQRFTVNGQACKRGTKCERNLAVGFWSCEPEDAEPGTWDYCCEPNHHCGFSQGYNYPWCYVGSSVDQWRPCNDKYYPYQLNPRPNRPTTSRPSYSRDDSDANYHSRHWPITFLHGETPPNGTDSVALANDVNDKTITDKPIEPVVKIDFNISSEPTLNHTMKRGVDELITTLNKRRKNPLTIVPLKLIGNGIRRNRTRGKFSGQRLNARYKKPTAGENVTVNYSPRFSRDGNNGQYYITKKLNARFATRSISGNEQSKGKVAKVERIMNNDNSKNGSSGISVDDSVSTLSSMTPRITTMNNSLNVMPVSLKIMNGTISSNVTENNWIKMKTIDKLNV